MCVCVCTCMRACMCACLPVCVCVCVCMYEQALDILLNRLKSSNFSFERVAAMSGAGQVWNFCLRKELSNRLIHCFYYYYCSCWSGPLSRSFHTQQKDSVCSLLYCFVTYSHTNVLGHCSVLDEALCKARGSSCYVNWVEFLTVLSSPVGYKNCVATV